MPLNITTINTKARLNEIITKLGEAKTLVDAKTAQFNTDQAYGCKAEAEKASLLLADKIEVFTVMQNALADAQLQNP